jgi:DNA-binding NarL/FixJ family response regulator
MIQAVAKILAKEFEVVGFARDGEETLRTVIHLKPDVVVMDIIMPMLDGIRVAWRLKEMNSPTKTVLLSGLEDQEYVEASLAVVPKDSYSRSVLSEIFPGAFTRSWREGFLCPPGLDAEQIGDSG